MTTRATGIALAFVTAVVSGVAVYVNSRGVAHFDDATVYTTAKNSSGAPARARIAAARGAQHVWWPCHTASDAAPVAWAAAVACIGGSVPFVLFFEGLARRRRDAGRFIHKTLVVWVALLAVPLLRERLGPRMAAIGSCSPARRGSQVGSGRSSSAPARR